ncbi:MAG: UDP-N-acetylmuramoyl-tripeptide--D-alanyl-D-alanine ligase [Burkholderiales bacterium]|jgi:UDP-N-acetylmuramoyl-tripeptide--D-alanyl-D-alanine ligase|nr:UDP-N-acetylmuramoyl-tripeptide--D-alanyl-D-alanine ligase [Nitrosomonadaceae bacterium]
MSATSAKPSMTLRETAFRLSGRLQMAVGGSGETAWHGVSTDTRTVSKDELFVALRGENFDAHDFVHVAAAQGAFAALVSRPVDVAIPQIVVGDTMWAYGQLAQYWRSRFSVPTVAITGSNGKTTVKEMLRAIMVAHTGDANAVLATEGNLNNNIGVPRMLLRLNAAHRIAVLEMGMNHLHEIDYLSRLAVPDAALIIMAGTAHIGELGSREAIAQAKGEIYAGLRDDGIACVNVDDRFADYWLALIGNDNRRRIVSFGTHPRAVVRGELAGHGLRLHIDGAREDVNLLVAGQHNQRNAIAAAAGAHALGIPLATIASGLRSFAGVPGRLRTYRGHKGATIIDDTYNANPDSMRAAIAVLAASTDNKVLVLGDMGELGDDAAAMHAEIGQEAKRAGIDTLLATGELAREYVRAFGAGATHAADIDALNALVTAKLSPQTTVLVKGSRFMRMERVVAALVEPSAQDLRGH